MLPFVEDEVPGALTSFLAHDTLQILTCIVSSFSLYHTGEVALRFSNKTLVKK